MLKQVVTALKMVPIVEAVHVPFFTKFIDDQEQFVGDEGHLRMVQGLLKELVWWTNKLEQ